MREQLTCGKCTASSLSIDSLSVEEPARQLARTVRSVDSDSNGETGRACTAGYGKQRREPAHHQTSGLPTHLHTRPSTTRHDIGLQRAGSLQPSQSVSRKWLRVKRVVSIWSFMDACKTNLPLGVPRSCPRSPTGPRPVHAREPRASADIGL